MNRPALTLQTLYFHASDRPDAERLGHDLYAQLTRPLDDPLAHGPGIPVRIAVQANRADLQAADTNVLIPVLGKICYTAIADQVTQTLNEWSQLADPALTVLPVPASPLWQSREERLPGKLLDLLYLAGDTRRRTLDEIVLAITRLWHPRRGNVQLFISHARADLAATDSAAKKIHDFVATDSTGKAFFDARDLRPGESLDAQLDAAVEHGVLIVVRGDAYSSRVWCQRELLLAKLHGLPTLSVEVLRRGETRSSPYGGNNPSLVWDGQPARVVSLAMIEWLRSQFFCKEARHLVAAAGLPEDVAVVARPPELLDLAQGPLQSDHAQLVLYPDPELSVLERRVLKSARPRLHLATPTTAFRRLLGRRDEVAEGSSPLEGRQVAMSLSDASDAEIPEGFARQHLVDATVFIARALISAGAAIAYGGDFRPSGYTPLLAQLIQTYNQTATKSAQDLHSYLAATVPLAEAPDDIPLSAHHLKESPELARQACLPDPAEPDAPPAAFYISDLRRVMARQTAARVILGGKTEPRTETNPAGYGGRHPGVIEEAWRTLQAGKPLYVIGGFGGAAAWVADLMEGKEIPAKLRDDAWMAQDAYAKNARALDAHPLREKLGLPARLEDLASALAGLAAPLLRGDDSSPVWNGLSREENQILFRSRDPVTLAALVSKGLLRVAGRQDADKLQIELIHDNLMSADKLDAIAIATLEGVPLGGAGAAIDHLAGGGATDARSRGRTLVSLKKSLIDADWLFLASLGALGDPQALVASAEEAARETASQAAQHGFQRVGVVTFGGNVLPDTGALARAMLHGFRGARSRAALAWYETDKDRFEQLRAVFEQDPGVKLLTRRALTRILPSAHVPEQFILLVGWKEGWLSATCLPPLSTATVSMRQTALPEAELARLAGGAGPGKRSTPGSGVLEERGGELAGLLLGPQASSILSRCQDHRLLVVHDLAASKLPYETLCAAPGLRPALRQGVTRRLSVPGLTFERQFAKPPKQGKLAVLLVANPTDDLSGADEEANNIKQILRRHDEHLSLEELWKEEATVANVTAALARADVFHYCGHGYFEGEEPARSGLILAGGARFTGENLAGIDPLPRLAFVNACEASRIRGRANPKPAAFAELFLRSGMDAYLGAYWEVADHAATRFAEVVYTHLAEGETLEQAVLEGRRALFQARESDWANYKLFGGGAFRMVAQV